MKSDVPILTITLQIPILPETNADEVLDEIGQQVSQAIYEIRQQLDTDDDAEVEEGEEVARVSAETLESFTEVTQEDQLAKLGYAPGE
jgi:hypothetical protein